MEQKVKNAPVKKVNNGEGVKASFEKAIENLPTRFDKMWAVEKSKKFLINMMFSFLPPSKKQVFRIGKFTDTEKYSESPKICTMTGFAVSDTSFKMDEVTKKFFEAKGKKVNKLVYSIVCFGSTNSDKIISEQALESFYEWVGDKVFQEKEGILEGNEFTTLMEKVKRKSENHTNGNFKNKKQTKFVNKYNHKTTHTLGEKYDFDSTNQKFNKK